MTDETVKEAILDAEDFANQAQAAEVGEQKSAEKPPHTEEEPPLSLEEQLEAARAEAAKQYDNFLRANADLVNAKRRFEQQRLQTYVNVNVELVGKILPAFDDLERAMANAPDTISGDPWFSGISMVQRKFLTTLENLNIKPIEAMGQPFDPNFHDALSMEPSDEFESGVVTREMVKGYQIGDRVIRPSLVFVAE